MYTEVDPIVEFLKVDNEESTMDLLILCGCLTLMSKIHMTYASTCQVQYDMFSAVTKPTSELHALEVNI